MAAHPPNILWEGSCPLAPLVNTEWGLRRCPPQFLVMCVTDPSNLPLDVDRTQCPEASAGGVNAKVTRQMLAVGRRRRVEDGMGVDRTVHTEVEIGHAAVAGCRQHLGQHRHDAVFVL